MTEFESFEKEYALHNEAVGRANALTKDVVFDALEKAAITTVTVDFDGEGDSGQIEGVVAYRGDRQVRVPTRRVAIHTAHWGSRKVTSDEQPLKEAIETLCYGYLEQEHGGWENNDGAYGEFQFDVFKRTIELVFNGRFSDVTTQNHTL